MPSARGEVEWLTLPRLLCFNQFRVYSNQPEKKRIQVHSDICEHATDGKFSEEHKAFLKECFDEFLENFEKTTRYSGYFVVNAEDWNM